MAPSIPAIPVEIELTTLVLAMSAFIVATLRLAVVTHLRPLSMVTTETVAMSPFPTAMTVPVAAHVAGPRPIPYVGLPSRRFVPSLTVPTRAPAAVPASMEVGPIQTTTRPSTVVPVPATTPSVIPTAA